SDGRWDPLPRSWCARLRARYSWSVAQRITRDNASLRPRGPKLQAATRAHHHDLSSKEFGADAMAAPLMITRRTYGRRLPGCTVQPARPRPVMSPWGYIPTYWGTRTRP